MIASIIIDDRKGRRTVSPGDLPLSLGGPDADIRIPGVAVGEPAAWIGISEQELFIEAGKGVAPIACNGVPVVTSQWLRAGDILRIGAARIVVEIQDGAVHLTIEQVAQRTPTGPPMEIIPAPASSAATDARGSMIRPVEFRPLRMGRAARRRSMVRWRLLIIAAVAVSLAGIAWFAATARSVVIRIDPEPEQVILETGWSGVRLGERYLIQPGRYTLIAYKSGHRRLEVLLEVGEDRQQSYQFSLERLPGRLVIDTGDVAGAEVVIDGEPAGVTPLDPIELTPGEHEVRVVAERYAEQIERVIIEGAGALQTLRVDLASRAAAIRFFTRPAGATVRVDGNRIGVTPLSADLLEGKHRVEYSLAGYKPFDDSLAVEAGRPLDLPPVELVPADGTIVLSSEPAGAAVTVDGAYRGETPLDLSLPPGRDHTVRLSKPGHAPDSRQIRIGSGDRREITMQLEVIEGEVEIEATPPDATLYVNGEAHGRAAVRLRLPAIPQAIEIRKDGYVTYRTTIIPRPGFPQAIRVTLETVEEAEALPPRIESPQGQELILVQGGRFRMGAPRREPGRRANESLREVNLTRSFYVSSLVVSNAEFRRFRAERRSGAGGPLSLDADDHPVVRVTWEDAALYCNWLSEQASLPAAYVLRDGLVIAVRPPTGGYRLPSEAEWAWVARYSNGPQPTKYPWGDALPVAPESGNYADAAARELLARVIQNYEDSFPATSPVDSFRANALGLYNIGGNVAEWVHDIYAIYPSGASTIETDPVGPDEGELHVIRGSSWMDSSVSELRLTYRDYGKKARPDVGFRIVRYAE